MSYLPYETSTPASTQETTAQQTPRSKFENGVLAATLTLSLGGNAVAMAAVDNYPEQVCEVTAGTLLTGSAKAMSPVLNGLGVETVPMPAIDQYDCVRSLASIIIPRS